MNKAGIQDYWTLCKPRVVALMIITLWVGMYLVGYEPIPVTLLLATTLGVAALASAGAAMNHAIDANIDAKMHRTKSRPLPKGRLTTKQAWVFSWALAGIGFVVLLAYVNVLTACLTFATTIGYGVLYTMFLKRKTSQNIVIGGLFGAMPPMLGWTAVTGHISPESALLVLIIFVWTPAHFWALAIHRIEEYKKVNIPMLPVTHGIRYTKLQIILYTVFTLIASILPFVTHMSGMLYFLGALALGLRFLYWAIRLYFTEDSTVAMQTFRFSNLYLMALFVLLLLDHYFWVA